MNFKTTSILLILLAAVGIYMFVTRDQVSTDTVDKRETKKLLPIAAADVQAITVTPSGGKAMSFKRDGMTWKMVQPIAAPAESGLVQAIVSDIASLESQNTTDVTDGTGLKSPKFVVDLTTKDGKASTLNIGDRSAIGERLYVQVKGNKQADVVVASIDEQLDKPLDDFRMKKLVTLGTPEIKHVVLERPAGKLELVKTGETWKVTAPQEMPADASAVSDLLFAINGLSAAEFVEDDANSPLLGLGEAARSITISTSSPATTQPTTQAAPIKILVGRPDTLLQKNLYAMVEGSGAVVKVPKESLAFLDRKPIELREKTVVDIEPKSVNAISVTIDRPATTRPTTKPAEKTAVAVTRRPPPATMPATTQASTQPAPSAWISAAPQSGDANDSAVNAILSALHPLKAEKFVESAPESGTMLNVTLETGGGGVFVVGKTQLQIVDPGDAKPPVATYNGLHFEIERSLLTKLEADFAKPGKAEAVPAPEMGPSMQMMP